MSSLNKGYSYWSDPEDTTWRSQYFEPPFRFFSWFSMPMLRLSIIGYKATFTWAITTAEWFVKGWDCCRFAIEWKGSVGQSEGPVWETRGSIRYPLRCGTCGHRTTLLSNWRNNTDALCALIILRLLLILKKLKITLQKPLPMLPLLWRQILMFPQLHLMVSFPGNWWLRRLWSHSP